MPSCSQLSRRDGFAAHSRGHSAWSWGRLWTISFVLLPAAMLLGAALHKLARGWRLSHMQKGAHAEERVGQAIEYALTRERCAVAHHVEGIARVGDIDHLVATPRGLWVVETKHRLVPRSEFPETLAANRTQRRGRPGLGARNASDRVLGLRRWARRPSKADL